LISGIRTYFLKIDLIKKARITKIKMWNPMKFSEKISKKNPPIKAEKIPIFFSGFSKTVIRITAIKTRFKIQPKKSPPGKILKWIKKLV
jgi:hypothetical protein